MAATFGGLGVDPAFAAAGAGTTPVCSPIGSVVSGLGGLLGGSGSGSGDGSGGPGEVYMTQSAYTANESQGELWITIQRSSTAGLEQVRYGVKQATGSSPLDFQAVPNALATLLPGQASCQFAVKINDLGMNGPSVTADAYLFGSSHATLRPPNNSTVTILRNDPLQSRDPSNPLELSSVTGNGDLLTGARFYVAGSASAAGEAVIDGAAGGQAIDLNALRFIAEQPQGYRFWFWNTPADPAGVVSHYLEDAESAEPGTVVQLSTYSLVHGSCPSTANHAFTQRYLNWVRGLAQGIGNFRVVLFFELDSLITSPCLNHAQLRTRLADQLKPAIEILEQDPHLLVYIDGGASDALPATADAARLREAGVQDAQGFFLNSTHFEWDTTEIQYGQRISRLLGGHVHFLIDSGENGRGPLLNPDPETEGIEDLCNPPGRGLGPISTETGYTDLDALLWFAPVGNSGGACRPGAPPTAAFWPAYAISLFDNRDFQISGPKLALSRDGTYAPYGSAFGL